jgi:hypothetical protein
MKLHDISFSQALVRMNIDFGLGLSDNTSPQESRSSAERRRFMSVHEDERRRRRREYAVLSDAYRSVFSFAVKYPDSDFAKQVCRVIENRLDTMMEVLW